MRLTTEQLDLRAAVRGLLDRQAAVSPPDDSTGPAGPCPPADYGVAGGIWPRLCREIGVAGLLIPERFGGAGAGLIEVAVVMEELGRSLSPSPMLGSAILATTAVLSCGDEAALERLLPGLADGTTLAALAWTTAAGRFDPAEVACTAAAAGEAGVTGRWLVSGEAHYVLDGARADVLLIPATMPDGQLGLFEAPAAQAAVTRNAATSMDDTRPLATVRLDGATGQRIGDVLDLSRARDAACAALAAEQAGAAAGALARTVDYARVRVQFGVPIGTFQALQHRMADLYVLAQAARSVAYAAAEAIQQGAPDAALRAATAKVYCSEALQRVSAEMIQLHGAIGMTWEHQAHRYFKRGHGSAMLLGTPASHVARIAAAVIDH